MGCAIDLGKICIPCVTRVCKSLSNSMDVNYTIVIHAVFWKCEYPCETRLPGSMGDPIISYVTQEKLCSIWVRMDKGVPLNLSTRESQIDCKSRSKDFPLLLKAGNVLNWTCESTVATCQPESLKVSFQRGYTLSQTNNLISLENPYETGSSRKGRLN